MALMVDLLEIVSSVPLIQIHVDVSGFGEFFPEQNGFCWVLDGSSFDSVRPLPKSINLILPRAQALHEIVVETIDDVAAIWVLIITHKTGDSKTVAGTSYDFPTYVIRFQPKGPGIGYGSSARREFVVMIRGVHGRRHRHLTIIV